MIKTMIITGATGFVGRWFVRGCLSENKKVLAVVRPDTENLGMLPEDKNLGVIFCGMDRYQDLPELVDAGFIEGASAFYHLAWSGVSGGLRASLDAQLANVKAAGAAVDAAVKLGCAKFIGLGTIMEYESAASAEKDGLGPGMGYIYGGAKHYAHLLTKILCAQSGIPHIWAMITNAYGEYEFSPRFINTTLRKIIKREPLEFTAGTQLYDFIHVEDVSRALLLLGESGAPFTDYMVSSGHAQPLKDYIELIGRILAPEQPLHFGDIPYTGAQLTPELFSNEKLVRDTGFQTTVPFEAGIKNLMGWMRKNTR